MGAALLVWGVSPASAITFPLKALRVSADSLPDTGRPSCPPWTETGAHEADHQRIGRPDRGEEHVERRGGEGCLRVGQPARAHAQDLPALRREQPDRRALPRRAGSRALATARPVRRAPAAL